MRLCVSTLGMHEWGWEGAVSFAGKHGVDLEVRALAGRLLDPAGVTGAQRALMRAQADAAGVRVVALGASTRLGADPEGTAARLGEVEAFARLAEELGASLVRVYGAPPEAGHRLSARQREEWAEAVRLAARHGVTLALETHDPLPRGDQVAAVVEALPEGVGAVWDVLHPVRHGERPADTWAALGARVVHVHLKDASWDPDGRWHLVPLGEGDVPLGEIVALLRAGGYAGALCVEWERMWHPELAPPEETLPAQIRWLRARIL